MTSNRDRKEIPGMKMMLISASFSIFALSACASAPPMPVDALQAADTAIKQAEDARVADYDPDDLRLAREKVAAARATSERAAQDKDEKEMRAARGLAEESLSYAELATAKAQAARADLVNKEMQRNNDTLQQEIQRKGGN